MLQALMGAGSGTLGTLGGSSLPFGSLMSSAMDFGTKWLGNELFGKSNAKDAREFSHNMAIASFDREYDAYKSRYQDTMTDMRRAGLNPILAASGGFNVGSGPGGGTPGPGIQAPAPMIDSGSSAQSFAQAEKNVADTAKSKSETALNRKRAIESVQKALLLRAQTSATKQGERESVARMLKAEQEFARITHEIDKVQSETLLNESQKAYVNQLKSKAEAEIERIGAEVSHLRKLGDVYDGPIGKLLAYLEAITKSIGWHSSVIGHLKPANKGGGVHVYNQIKGK